MKKNMSYREFEKQYYSQHSWGGRWDQVTIPSCPQHPGRAARTVRDRSLDHIYLSTDNKHIHVQRSYIMNPYYRPQEMGLELIGTLEEDLSYEFCIVAAWVGPHTTTSKGLRSTTHRIYWAQDSGCSCPSPFEGYASIDKLHVYDGTTASWQELVYWVDEQRVDDADRVDFLRKVQDKYREVCT